jgi:hypothetical protein
MRLRIRFRSAAGKNPAKQYRSRDGILPSGSSLCWIFALASSFQLSQLRPPTTHYISFTFTSRRNCWCNFITLLPNINDQRLKRCRWSV